MAKNFNDLATEAEASWDENTKRVYRAASETFAAEVRERAELGAMIAKAREALSLSQDKLSEVSGVRQPEISRIERGVANPTANTLIRLADALDVRLTLAPR